MYLLLTWLRVTKLERTDGDKALDIEIVPNI